MLKKTITLFLVSITLFLTSYLPSGQYNASPYFDLSSATGGLFSNYWADFACGVGVGLAIGAVAFLSGGTALIAEAIVAPKMLATCIYAGLL